MSVEILKNYLITNPDEIVKILELTDFHTISFSEEKREIRCAYYEGGNPTSVCINCDTLQSYVFSKGVGGDLFYLISLHNNWNLNKRLCQTFVKHFAPKTKLSGFSVILQIGHKISSLPL